MEILAELMSSKVRAAVLGFLVAHGDARFSLTELSRALGLSISSLQHECYKLERLGLLVGRREGVSRRYLLNPDNEVTEPTVTLVRAVLGSGLLLGLALTDVDGLAGALLTTGEPQRLVLVGHLGLESMETIRLRAASVLGVRDLELAFHEPESWRVHVATTSPAFTSVRDDQPILLFGDVADVWPAGHVSESAR